MYRLARLLACYTSRLSYINHLLFHVTIYIFAIHQLVGGVSEFGLGVGVFLVKKLVSGLMPLVETFLSCLTPRLSVLVLFFFFFSASSLSSAERLFGIPNVLIASLPPDEMEAEDEAAERLGVERLLLVEAEPSPMPDRYASYAGNLQAQYKANISHVLRVDRLVVQISNTDLYDALSVRLASFGR